MPDSYTIVPAVAFKKEKLEVPNTSASHSGTATDGHLKEAILGENSWLQHAIELLSQSELETGDKIAWTTYHATQCSTSSSCTTLTQLMPLFYDKAASAAMVKHGMTVQRKAIQYLNPG